MADGIATDDTDGITLRTAREDDYPAIAEALHRWWLQPGFDTELATRERVAMVPRLWLQHFAGTSLVAYEGEALRGFLVGFLSADRDDEGYIHFVGVHPELRRRGLGRRLYGRFFEVCRAAGRRRVRCVATPSNALSIAWHRALGFAVEPAVEDYDGPGITRVRFVREV